MTDGEQTTADDVMAEPGREPCGIAIKGEADSSMPLGGYFRLTCVL